MDKKAALATVERMKLDLGPDWKIVVAGGTSRNSYWVSASSPCKQVNISTVDVTIPAPATYYKATCFSDFSSILDWEDHMSHPTVALALNAAKKEAAAITAASKRMEKSLDNLLVKIADNKRTM